jgi:outer membrane lipoprotein-sorting protein
VASICTAAPPASQPTSAPAVDPQLQLELTEIDARASHITTLAADFEQKKYTALLRKPLISSGVLRIKGASIRWDTERPEKSVMLVSGREFQLYYPAQNAVEIYTLDQRLAQLAASPLPRLAVLRDRFAFAQIPAAEMDRQADPAKFVALKLTPIQDELRQRLREVRVLLDVAAGYIVQAEFTDADGDRTVMTFRKIQINAEVGDLELKLPAGTKISRPLEGLR